MAKILLKNTIAYTDEQIGKILVLPDFLPPPAELEFHEEGVKVTLMLSKKSVKLYKLEASTHQT